MNNDPLDLNYEAIDDEERYRSVGITNSGRLLSVVFTVRNGRLRAVTAFPASVPDTKAFLESAKGAVPRRHTAQELPILAARTRPVLREFLQRNQ